MTYKINLCDEYTCTQCFACQQVCPKNCITRKEVGAGFFIPEIDRDTCIECGACMKSCHKLREDILYQKPLHAYACWTKNLDDREHSSSGGAFSVFARKILSSGGIVFGSSMNNNLKVQHIGIECEEDIRLLQGSKYLQSEIVETYKVVRQNLKEGRKVLFTGTPCQVAGLYAFLKRKPENLFTCDIVCHGVPSQKAFDIYVDKVGLRKDTREIGFRFTKGWGFQMSRLLVDNTKKEKINKRIINPNKGFYIRAFNAGLMFNESCFNCPYARPERVSDMTIADYWGLGNMRPFKHPTNKGISMLLVNNEHGIEFIKSCDSLYREERPIAEAVQGNGNLNKPSQRPIGRDSYYEDSIKLNIKALQEKYHIRATIIDYLRILKQTINSLR